MSADANENQQRLSFQHFDQEFDFGIEDENGERVRKRKRPGRKPNPPSLQERRAQNRAAQKAFRAREQHRKQEKEKQWKAYSDEIIRLKKRLAQAEYEAKYLKGHLLQLSLAFLVYRGTVPNVWIDTRIYDKDAAEAAATAAASEPHHFTSQNGYQGSDETPFINLNSSAEINQTPELLNMILEENNYIVDFEKALAATEISRCTLKVGKKNSTEFHPFNEFLNSEVQTMNKEAQQPNKFFPKSNALSIRSFQQRKEINKNAAPAINTIGFQQTIQLSPLQTTDTAKEDNALTVHQKPVRGVIFEPPTLRTPDDLAAMPSLQALHILRLQLKTSSILGEATPVALLPTALQRVIPHDIRIDYIPGPAIRDRLILFQDYYNADECFQSLIQSTIFVGGDVRDAQNWKSDPSYSLKFWFVSHHLFDQSFQDFMDGKTISSILEGYYSDDREDKMSKQTFSSQESPVTPSSAQSDKNTPILLQPDICFTTTSR